MENAQKIIDEAGVDSILFAHRAANMFYADQVEDALKLSEEGVKMFPFYAEGHYVLARCYQTLEKNEAAKEEFERTLHFSPGHLKAIKALAYLNYKNKFREKGNDILLNMALYDPLNTELIDFLKTENLYSLVFPEIQPEGSFIDETNVEFKTSSNAQTPAENPPAEVDAFFPEEEIDFPEPEETTSKETEIAEPETEAEQVETETSPEAVETIQEAALLGDDFEEELFNEDGNISLIDPVGSNVDLAPDNIGDIKKAADVERDNFERNSISERLDETATFEKKIDLDQFDNTKDDFSTLMEGYFTEPDEEVSIQDAAEMDEVEEPEQAVEERPLLDTSVIFREKRTEDKKGTAKEESVNTDTPVRDINKVADEIEQMSTEEILSIEEDMAESLEEQQSGDEAEVEEEPALFVEDSQEEVVSEQVIEEAASVEDTSGTEITSVAEEELPDPKEESFIDEKPGKSKSEQHEITDVIDRIEQAPVRPAKSVEKLDADGLDMLDEEDVNIEDILENPNLLTPTFGEILIAQKKFSDAREVFSALLKKDSGNARFQKKLEFLDKIVAMNK